MLYSLLLALLLFSNTDCVSADSSVSCKINDGEFLQRSTSKFGLTPHYLNCSLDPGKVATRITWKRQNNTLKEGAGPIRWLGLSFNKTAMKSVEDLRCEVMIGKQIKSCGISLEAPPHITSRLTQYDSVFIGDPLVIPCYATGSPEPVITWTKISQSLAQVSMPRSVKKIKGYSSLDMVIKKLSKMHSGFYTCHAVNRLGKDTHFVFVAVSYQTILLPPRVVPLRHIVTVKKGATAILVCTAKNTPRRYTAVFWDHQGTRIKKTVRLHLRNRYSFKIIKKMYKAESTVMSLTISHVTTKDVGLYTCGVSTHVGSHQDHVELKIKE